VKAVVQAVHSPDSELETFVPADAASFALLVEVTVGSDDDSPGGDIFSLIVCTPGWLASKVAQSGSYVPRHHLVVGWWDWSPIRSAIVENIEREDAPTWAELAERVGRFAHWEFEDYRD
jgi:Immunity protein 8